MKQVMILSTPAEIAEGIRMFMSEHAAPKQNPEKLYSITQASKLLGKSFSTISRMIKDGRLEATADGKNISQKSIDRYISEEK